MPRVDGHVGRYRLLEQIGSGGMSAVYRALDTALDREVAVKVLHPHLAGKEESRRRLSREAQAVAKLRHPNVLEVFDFSPAEAGEAYIVTEYIRGQTLRDFVARERLHPPEIAAMIVHELAAALAHAHEAGVIHRDIKPENVMVREDGVLKLMDFGIAKLLDRDERMTMTGALVGSPAHMAPEIIEGEAAGPEADLFSLGTLLYFLATSRLPFEAPNTTALLKRILDGAYLDPRQVAPAVSDDLAEIIATCLARQPSARYSSAGKLRDALAGYLGSLGLTQVGEELANFFARPEEYRRALGLRVVDRLLLRAQDLAAQRPARALAAVNQVLALDGGNMPAHRLLARMSLARKRRRALVLGGRVALAAAGLAMLLAVGAAWRERARASAGVSLASRAGTATPHLEPTPTPAAPLPSLAPAAASIKRPLSPAPRAAARAAPPATPRIPIQIRIVPWGSLQFEDGTRFDEERQLHTVQLVAGRHEITARCKICEPTQVEIAVAPEGERTFHIKARLKPAKVRFDYQPPEAVVRLDGAVRSAGESQRRPFEVSWLATPAGVRHRVHYEVSLKGYQTATGDLELEPGEDLPIAGALRPQ